ncbi:MAG: D-aminoacyl-tRNA deacylase [Candidatus Cloacimonetes bacterium]|nr:D-aminoacyl-tRNA deacylase [Candidatus Cloacimonadota bacterium]
MKLLIQRVINAEVKVDNKTISEINQGLLVFLGIHNDDIETNIDFLIKKLTNLRIYEDEKGKMNLSIQDIKGSILLISQFTLHANCKRGNRPDFTQAANPEKAKQLYDLFIQKLKHTNIKVKSGIFGADMKVSLINDGPVTIILEI